MARIPLCSPAPDLFCCAADGMPAQVVIALPDITTRSGVLSNVIAFSIVHRHQTTTSLTLIPRWLPDTLCQRRHLSSGSIFYQTVAIGIQVEEDVFQAFTPVPVIKNITGATTAEMSGNRRQHQRHLRGMLLVVSLASDIQRGSLRWVSIAAYDRMLHRSCSAGCRIIELTHALRVGDKRHRLAWVLNRNFAGLYFSVFASAQATIGEMRIGIFHRQTEQGRWIITGDRTATQLGHRYSEIHARLPW